MDVEKGPPMPLALTEKVEEEPTEDEPDAAAEEAAAEEAEEPEQEESLEFERGTIKDEGPLHGKTFAFDDDWPPAGMQQTGTQRKHRKLLDTPNKELNDLSLADLATIERSTKAFQRV